MVILQCESGHLNGDLIACARHRIYDLQTKVEKGLTTHVLFIIHIPRQISCSLIGYQEDPWISAHIDDLNESGEYMIELHEISRGAKMSELFIGERRSKDADFLPYSTQTSENTVEELEEEIQEDIGIDNLENVGVDLDVDKEMESLIQTTEQMNEDKSKNEDNLVIQYEVNLEEHFSQKNRISNAVKYKNPLFKRLYRCIQPAASKLQDLTVKRSAKRVELLIHLIPKDICYNPGKCTTCLWILFKKITKIFVILLLTLSRARLSGE